MRIVQKLSKGTGKERKGKGLGRRFLALNGGGGIVFRSMSKNSFAVFCRSGDSTRRMPMVAT